MVVGFILPPRGVIDGSVLTAIGELIVFPAMALGYEALKSGREVSFKKGEMEITVANETE